MTGIEGKATFIDAIRQKLGRMTLPNFGKRPAHTLLFITDTQTFRLDVDKTAAPLGDAEPLEAGCSAPAKLADCIAQAAAGGAPFGRKTWVLYARLPMTVLGMPAVQLDGLDEPSLVQALLFELEGLSGQPMLDMQLAYRLFGDRDEMRSYWVCLLNRLQLEDVDKAVRKAGSKLAGLLHPGALPRPLAGDKAEDWLRLECWPTQLAAVRQDGDGSTALQLFPFENRHWRSHLEQWLAAQGEVKHTETLHSEMLSNKAIELLPETGFTLNLGNEDALEGWLASWAVALRQKELPAPALRFVSGRNQDLVLMVSGAAAALAICSVHGVWNLYQARQFDDHVAKLKTIETSMTTLRKSVTEERDRYEKLRQKLDKLKGDSDTLPRLIEALQRRPSALLETLARGRPENLLLEEIAQEGDQIRISGISLDSLSANVLAGYLEDQLAGLGWDVVAPTKKNMQAFEGGGPWEFTIALQDRGVDGFGK